MHPRNKYAESPPDLAALARLYPSLQPYLIHWGTGRQRGQKRRKGVGAVEGDLADAQGAPFRDEEGGEEEGRGGAGDSLAVGETGGHVSHWNGAQVEAKGDTGLRKGEVLRGEDHQDSEAGPNGVGHPDGSFEQEGSHLRRHERTEKVGFRWNYYNATRELTRALLAHDFGVEWWIDDGLLCPTVGNRGNYIHWLQDLLALHPTPWHASAGAMGPLPRTTTPSDPDTQGEALHQEDAVLGLDIGTGANLIYPLLGASLCAWHFVATDVTNEGLSGAEANRARNPHLQHLITLRCARHCLQNPADAAGSASRSAGEAGTSSTVAGAQSHVSAGAPLGSLRGPAEEAGQEQGAAHNGDRFTVGSEAPGSSAGGGLGTSGREEAAGAMGLKKANETGAAEDADADAAGGMSTKGSPLWCLGLHAGDECAWPEREFEQEPLIKGVVGPTEQFDFCMCNPPFFEDIRSAGANPRTACGGTHAEMVYPGGEEAFIRRMIDDSLALRTQVHWYTTMVGRKVNLKLLSQHLRALNVPVVRSTEFVQGRTSRWGLAWSFTPIPIPSSHNLFAPGPSARQASDSGHGTPSACQHRDDTRSKKAGKLGKHGDGRKSQIVDTSAARLPLPSRSFTLEKLSRSVGAYHVLLSAKDSLARQSGVVPASCKVDESKYIASANFQVSGRVEEPEHEANSGKKFGVGVKVMQHAPGCVAVSVKVLAPKGSSEQGTTIEENHTLLRLLALIEEVMKASSKV